MKIIWNSPSFILFIFFFFLGKTKEVGCRYDTLQPQNIILDYLYSRVNFYFLLLFFLRKKKKKF
jgi:hypothetical protein